MEHFTLSDRSPYFKLYVEIRSNSNGSIALVRRTCLDMNTGEQTAPRLLFAASLHELLDIEYNLLTLIDRLRQEKGMRGGFSVYCFRLAV